MFQRNQIKLQHLLAESVHCSYGNYNDILQRMLIRNRIGFIECCSLAEHHTSNGSLIRSSSFMDLSDESDTQLPRHCSVSIDLLCSRSPSKVAAEEILVSAKFKRVNIAVMTYLLNKMDLEKSFCSGQTLVLFIFSFCLGLTILFKIPSKYF